jgi:CRISPR-associated protein Csb2
MTWDIDAAPQTVAALDGMARRVPYIGRSTGIALVAATATARPEADAGGVDAVDGVDAASTARFEPCDLLEAELSVRVPFLGFLEDLDAQFASGRPAWEASRYRGYRRVAPRPEGRAVAASGEAVPSVYPDVVVFRFAGLRPDGRLTVRFTEALRTAVLGSAGDDAPDALHGHRADGRPHVAFLALPDVGFEYSDGHLLGMAVAVPELPVTERQTVLRAVLGLRQPQTDGVAEIGVPGIGRVELVYQPGHVRPWGASPERWRQGSRRWVSATPVVLDHYPKRPGEVEAEILAGTRTVGLPDPVDIQVSIQPLQPGAVRLRPNDLPRRASGRLYRHVALTFDRVVHGPVMLGAGRYLGVGLLAPAVAVPVADVEREVRAAAHDEGGREHV